MAKGKSAGRLSSLQHAASEGGEEVSNDRIKPKCEGGSSGLLFGKPDEALTLLKPDFLDLEVRLLDEHVLLRPQLIGICLEETV